MVIILQSAVSDLAFLRCREKESTDREANRLMKKTYCKELFERGICHSWQQDPKGRIAVAGKDVEQALEVCKRVGKNALCQACCIAANAKRCKKV
jgi:hypothetical protein